MWNKIKNNSNIVLLIAIGAIILYFWLKMTSLTKELYDFKIKEKEKLSKVKDSLIYNYSIQLDISKNKFDSVLNLPPTIKWKKYEVPTYINRTLDDALNVHTEYKTNRLSE